MQQGFITGCNKITEWQLPWFIDNYTRHCKLPLVIYDFGMSEEMLNKVSMFDVVLLKEVKALQKAWWGKPYAMQQSPFDQTCWLDTDCQVLKDPSGVFNYVEPQKLAMVIDHPWTYNDTRNQMGVWHNSGVVAFEKKPIILTQWFNQCKGGEHTGDQECLHWMMGGDSLRKMVHIVDLPHKYNVVRLDMDKPYCPSDPVIKHWTGYKGNNEIKRMMRLHDA